MKIILDPTPVGCSEPCGLTWIGLPYERIYSLFNARVHVYGPSEEEALSYFVMEECDVERIARRLRYLLVRRLEVRAFRCALVDPRVKELWYCERSRLDGLAKLLSNNGEPNCGEPIVRILEYFEDLDHDRQTGAIRVPESIRLTQATHALIRVLDTDIRKDAAEILGRMGAVCAINDLVRRASVKAKDFESNPDATLTDVYVRAIERILEHSRTEVALSDLRLLVELKDIEKVRYRHREEPPKVYVGKREPIDCSYLRWLAREELNRRDVDHTVLVPKGGGGGTIPT